MDSRLLPQTSNPHVLTLNKLDSSSQSELSMQHLPWERSARWTRRPRWGESRDSTSSEERTGPAQQRHWTWTSTSPSGVRAGPRRRKCLSLASKALLRKNRDFEVKRWMDDESREVCLAYDGDNKSANQVKMTTLYKSLTEYLILAFYKQQQTQLWITFGSRKNARLRWRKSKA